VSLLFEPYDIAIVYTFLSVYLQLSSLYRVTSSPQHLHRALRHVAHSVVVAVECNCSSLFRTIALLFKHHIDVCRMALARASHSL
jgi:hypothetical protein